jgi:hypothetical protein
MRVRRRLFNLAAAVSLALCVATGTLWARSYWREDQLTYFNGLDCDVIGSSFGGISWMGLEYHRTAPL